MDRSRTGAGPSGADGQPGWWRTLAANRILVQAAVDAFAWVIALPVATFLRFEFDVTAAQLAPLAVLVPVAVVMQLVVGLAAGQYRGRWRYGSFEEVAALVRTVAVVTVLVAVVNRLFLPERIPVSATVGAGLIAILIHSGARYTWRLVLERRMRPTGEGATRVLLFGAGEGGEQLLTAILRNPASPLYPVALIDDDPFKQNLRLKGVPVVGGRQDLAAAASSYGATALVIAIPSADAVLIREVSAEADAAGLETMVVPSVRDLVGARVGVADVRPVTDADLLGRHAVDTDVESIAGYLTGRRVLVTGAGGSIGSELCRQIWVYAPTELVMLDRDESALHAVQLSLEGRALLDHRNVVVADLRDVGRLAEVFAEHRPEVVFHAGALKHLPLLEMYPGEAIKTNVWGTQHLLEQAVEAGVDRFVNVSTDKAADPRSVLGYTKRIAERLTAATDRTSSGQFLSVRFGNVLGSRGSVLTTFEAQLAAGGPLTVTHADATRYFMTVEEAVQLVIQAGAIGGEGDALVLDMGEPVSVMDIARRLVASSGQAADIVQTGLRPGEKLHETLFGRNEDGRPTDHPLITAVAVPPIDPHTVDDLDAGAAIEVLVDQLRRIAAADPSKDPSLRS